MPALALFPLSELPDRQKDNCVEYSILLKITVSKQIHQLGPKRSKRTNLHSFTPKLKHIPTQKSNWMFSSAQFYPHVHQMHENNFAFVSSKAPESPHKKAVFLSGLVSKTRCEQGVLYLFPERVTAQSMPRST